MAQTFVKQIFDIYKSSEADTSVCRTQVDMGKVYVSTINLSEAVTNLFLRLYITRDVTLDHTSAFNSESLLFTDVERNLWPRWG